MISGWNNYLDTLYREQSKLYNEIQGARTLGLSEDEIYRNLVDKAKLGSKEIATIMDGQFYPGYVADDVDDRLMMQIEEGRSRLVGDIPFAELDALTDSRMDQPLSPELFRRRQAQSVDEAEPAPVTSQADPLGDLFSGAAPAAPATGPVPVPAAPQAPQAPAATTPPSPSLLGGNLIDQLRNSEIAQRLLGQ
jgi:hypothetical protein